MINRKKIVLTLSILSCIGLVGCGNKENNEVHKCRLFEVEAVESTCNQEGNVAHDLCIYCNTRYLNGEVVTEQDVKQPIDENNHTHILSIDKIPEGCTENGMEAHQECEGCGTLFVNNQKVSESDLVIPSIAGGHKFDADLMCENCDSYKINHNGEEYLFDIKDQIQFANNMIDISHTYTAKDAVIKSAFENRMTFATQGQSILKVSNHLDSWRITQSLTSAPSNTYTRFALGNEKGEAYKGKILLGFDVIAHQEAKMRNFGARIVDSLGEDSFKETQPSLHGSDSKEENNKNRSLVVGKTYRFVYALETTAVDQLIQIWACSDTKTLDVSITNMYVVLVDGGTATVPNGKELLFKEM